MAGCPGYILVDVKTRKIIGICVLVCLLVLALGIVIGFFSGKAQHDNMDNKTTLSQKFESVCQTTGYTDTGKKYVKRRLTEYQKDACLSSAPSCLDYGLPRTYIAYHLGADNITVDGKMDEKAWQDVPWTENFVDDNGNLRDWDPHVRFCYLENMRSEWYPAPRLDTKVKMRWDDKKLYVGAYLQEKDLWATKTQQDAQIFKDNGFEMLVDVDGSMFNYKQMQVNCLGTTLDQVFTKSSHDDGTKIKNWTAGMEVAVTTKGTINNPTDTDEYWSVEWSFTFEALAAYSTRATPTPTQNDGEVWFMQFGRSEWHLRKLQNGYEKLVGSPVDWWSWQACGAVNLHLQNRWGLVQFRKNMNDKNFNFQMWHVYKTLFDVFEAMKAYVAVNSKYTTNLEDLIVPPYVFSQTCVQLPTIDLFTRNGQKDYNITVISKRISHTPAHIRSDRYVWFE